MVENCTVFYSTRKEKNICAKEKWGGDLESKPCSHCKKFPSNHCCLAEVRNSKMFVEKNENKHVCGRNICMICRSAWVDAEDFTNICIDHKSK